jgi:AcrR family transcriptional regulator
MNGVMEPAMERVASAGGWRGSAEVWLAAAYDALMESGIDGVKILPLAKRLNLSRTSFYWFFTDREALLSALVARWRDKNTGSIVARTEAYAETMAEAMLNVFDCWLNSALFDSRFEFAIRSWAMQSDAILAEVREADRIRIDALTRMLMRFGHSATAADVRARTVYLVQIGYITMQSQETTEVRLQRIPEYVSIFTGQAPQAREMQRFRARNKLPPAAGEP